jgi:hypothetical protein
MGNVLLFPFITVIRGPISTGKGCSRGNYRRNQSNNIIFYHAAIHHNEKEYGKAGQQKYMGKREIKNKSGKKNEPKTKIQRDQEVQDTSRDD